MSDPVMQNSSSPENNSSPATRTSSKSSLFGYTVIALGLALFIRFFIAAPYVVSGQSMEPTFDNWHYLIIDRLSYDLGEPERGDVIVFDLPTNTGRALIKRIIGLPGEEIQLSDSSVRIVNGEHPEGFLLDEPYIDPKNFGGASNMSVTLGQDQFFVLGDNRRVSADSRLWGVLPREDIVGRVLLRLYPLNELSVLPGTARYTENSPDQ